MKHHLYKNENTTSVIYPLIIEANTDNSNVSDGNGGVGMEFYARRGNGYVNQASSQIYSQIYSGAGTIGDHWSLNFSVRADDTQYTAMKIAATGGNANPGANIGIGTTSPLGKLDIGGNTDTNIQAILTRGNDPNFQLQAINSSSSNVSGAVVSKFGLRHGTDETALLHFIRGNGSADGSLGIVTNNLEAMRIDSVGNIGIGLINPSSKLHIYSSISNEPQALFQSDGDLSIRLNGQGGESYIEYVNNHTSTNAWKTGVNDSDKFELSYGAQGSANSSISAMFVDTTGKVGIKNSSPASALVIGSGSTNNQNSEGAYHGLAITTGIDDQTLWLGYDGTADISYINCAKTGSIRPICLQTRGGDVGVGTTSPQANLHVSGGTGDCVVIIEADTDNQTEADNPAIWFRQDGGLNEGAIGMDSNRLILVNNVSTSGGIAFFTGTTDNTGTSPPVTGATEKMTIDPSGNVGIGTTTPYAKLHVQGLGPGNAPSLAHASRTLITSTSVSANQSSGTALSGYNSIYATGAIISSGYIISHGTTSFSDRRIKANIVDVEDDDCLQKLRLIKPKQYTYNDTLTKGTAPVWGFIAQEVSSVLDYAVEKMQKAIPNIYKLASVSEDGFLLTFDEPVTLETMDNIKLQLKTFISEEHNVNVLEVLNSTTIRLVEPLTEEHHTGIVDDQNIIRKVFVYGQWVDDFHVLKKDAIFTVAVASLQEVDRRQQADNARILELEEEVALLKEQMAAVIAATNVIV